MSEPDRLRVTVQLYSVLRHRNGQIVDRLELELPLGSCARDVLEMLQVPAELEAVVAVNDEVTGESTPLSDGDCVAVVPAVSGG
jgi:molybdopterin converting factor small subunit